MESKTVLYARISSLYEEMISFEKQAEKIYGENNETIDTVGMAVVCTMNAMHQIEETLPKIEKETLMQALDVLQSIRLSMLGSRTEINDAYHHAVRRVATSYGITRNTVADIFIRRLGIVYKTEGFIDLVEGWLLEGDDSKLKQTLKRYTDFTLHDQIDKFFMKNQTAKNNE